MERTLTGKGLATRTRIVEGAAEELRRLGPVNASLDDVRLRSNTSKSQLFHYFPDGKAALWRAVTQHEADRVLADQQPYLDDLSTWESWDAWRDLVIERYRKQGQQCSLSVLNSQLGSGDPAIRAIVVDLLHQWRGRIARGIERMQATGRIAPEVDASRSASALLAGVQGGVSMMLVTGEMRHLEAALDLGLEQLR